MDKFNVLGGSLAFGHPLPPPGARMITQTLHELRRRGGDWAQHRLCGGWAGCGHGAGGGMMSAKTFSDIRKDGIGILTMDVPGETMNTLTFGGLLCGRIRTLLAEV